MIVIDAYGSQKDRPDETQVQCHGKTRWLGVPIDTFKEGMERYESGAYVQDAWPTMSADDREFLMSGLTPEEFAALTEALTEDDGLGEDDPRGDLFREDPDSL